MSSKGSIDVINIGVERESSRGYQPRMFLEGRSWRKSRVLVHRGSNNRSFRYERGTQSDPGVLDPLVFLLYQPLSRGHVSLNRVVTVNE